MAESIVLQTQPRDTTGSQKARQMRRKGLLPAVVYGHKEATLSVALPRDDVVKAIRHGARVVDLKIGGNVEKALIRDAQWDAIGLELLHVDFVRVSESDRVVVFVSVEVKGTAPGIAAGGVIDQPIHSLSVECPALAVPDSIRVNVGELQLGQAIHVKDLVLPPGVKAMAEPEAVVVHVTLKQLEEEVAPAAPVAAEPTEPEIIGRRVAEEAEEEPEK